MSLTAFADEIEREKARQRTYDAMVRKAKAGHVTGGRVFGYGNVEILGPPDAHGQQRRSHVEWRINEEEAVVVRRIFTLCAAGYGMRQIAHQLNDAGTACPRPQRGRPAGWSPSSLRAILYRPLYRGQIVWNRSRKRDIWGQVGQRTRPENEWLRQDAPGLQVVSDQMWDAAHARLAEARALYLRGTDGHLWGHPARGTESKYLLVGMAQCGVCGSGMSVRSRSHGRRRSFYYVCTAHHMRGRRVCANAQELPMDPTNAAVLDAVRDQVLSLSVVDAVIQRAIDRLLTPQPETDLTGLREDLASLEGELTRLTTALATGIEFPSVIEAIRERERRKGTVQRRLDTAEGLARIPDIDRRRLEPILRARLEDWHGLLGRHVPQARQMLRKLVIGRFVMTPDATGERNYAEIAATGTLAKFLSGVGVPKGMASPTGFEPVS